MKLSSLEGSWYIQLTNFPMWLKGDKKSPSFTYTVEVRKGKTGLSDKVSYLKGGKEKQILGFDWPLNPENTAFVWRGKGLLSLLSSKWQILYLAPTESWCLIYFQKTFFTPAGYDVISRAQELTDIQQEEIQYKLQELGISAELQALAS